MGIWTLGVYLYFSFRVFGLLHLLVLHNIWLYARHDHPSRSDILTPRRSHADLRLDGISYLTFPFFHPMQTSTIVLRLAAPLVHRFD